MPHDIDNSKALLRLLVGKIQPLIADHFNEAKTRIAFIDPILTDVLGWNPVTHINYEERYTKENDPLFPKDDEKRCIDYVVSLGEPILVVEAKKNLKQFELPTVPKNRFKLSGVIKECPNVWSAILQTREYCDYVGARYAVVTNGHQYVAFKALREVGKWYDGYAVVWRSLDELQENFSEFYMCLSRETIQQDRLTELANEQQVPIERHRPRTFLPVAGGSFRNDLHDVLHAVFASLLLDKADITREFLEKCYVSSEIAIKYGKQLSSVIVDTTPDFAAPIHPVRAGSKKDKFHSAINSLVENRPSNPLVVVMGGPGVGKTTFLQWYFEVFLPTSEGKGNKARDNAVVLTIDYRKIDCKPDEVRGRSFDEIGVTLKDATKDVAGTYAQLREVYRSEIEEAKKAELSPYLKSPEELDKKIGDLIALWRSDTSRHLKAMARYLQARCGGKQLVLILDNMDQKSEELQKSLYQTAQELVFSAGVIVVLAMREATYRHVQGSPQFNAFSPVQFHVMMQPVRIVLDARLAYLNQLLGEDAKIIKNVSQIPLSVGDLRTLIKTINNTLAQEPAIIDGIEALSNGNTRDQLRTVYSFLVSGQTKITEYLFKQQQYVPLHEFLDSIIYEDQRVFVEKRGQRFMNVFSLGGSKNSSHFTVLRLLAWLKNLGQEGDLAATDYLRVDAMFEQFEPQGISRADIEADVQRMAQFGLLMPESQDPTSFQIGETFALAKCGLFYLERLYMHLSYTIAMAADTNWTDKAAAQICAGFLKPYMGYPKVPLGARLSATREFFTYLTAKEERELKLGAVAKHPIFGALKFVPAMWTEFNAVELKDKKRRDERGFSCEPYR